MAGRGIRSSGRGGKETLGVSMIIEAISVGFDKITKDATSMTAALTREQTKLQSQQSRMQTGVALLTQKYDEQASAQQRLIEQQRKQTEQSKKLADQQLKVGAAFSAAAVAGGALLYSSVKLAARVETLGIVTEHMGEQVGLGSEQMKKLEESVAASGITLRSTRESIALMIQANIDLSKATDLARLAQNAAVITGQNSSETFRDLTYAISTGNRIMLRRMMLSADFESAYKREAAAMGKTTAELSELEKIQIRANEVMARGARITGVYEKAMETAGKKVLSLERHIEESKRMLGEQWLPVYAEVVDFITNSLKSWEALDQDTKNVYSSIFGVVTALSAIEGVAFIAMGAIGKLTLSMQGGALAAIGLTAATAGVIAAFVAVGALAIYGIVKYGQHIKKEADAWVELEDAIRDTATTYEEYVELRRRAEAGETITAGDKQLKAPQAQQLVPVGGIMPTMGGPFGQMPQYTLRSLAPPEMTEEEFTQQDFGRTQARGYAARLRSYKRWLARQQREQAARSDRLGGAGKYLAAEGGFNYGLGGRERGRGISLRPEDEVDPAMFDRKLSVAAGVEAGVGGALGGQLEDLKAINNERERLNTLLEDAKSKYGENSQQVQDLTAAMNENVTAQADAASSIAEATAQMIYQQAAAGLDAVAALNLARAMGVLSEADYAVAKVIQDLRNEYDKDADGLITVAEGAHEYAEKVDDVREAVDNLIETQGDFDLADLSAALEAPEGEGIAGEMEAADEATGNLIEKEEPLDTMLAGMATDAEVAKDQFAAIVEMMNAITGDHAVTFSVGWNDGEGPPGGGYRAPAGQQGASYGDTFSGAEGFEGFIPPGYPNDTFKMGLTSGEYVSVRPPGVPARSAGSVGIAGGGGGGDFLEGDSYYEDNVYVIQDQAAMALALAQKRIGTYTRLDARMGA